DPIVSNSWTFYTPAEHQAIAAFLQSSSGYSMWVGPTDRLRQVARASYPAPSQYESVVFSVGARAPQDWLRSPAIVASGHADNSSLPAYGSLNQVYDNGDAQIDATPPRTPFQVNHASTVR